MLFYGKTKTNVKEAGICPFFRTVSGVVSNSWFFLGLEIIFFIFEGVPDREEEEANGEEGEEDLGRTEAHLGPDRKAETLRTIAQPLHQGKRELLKFVSMYYANDVLMIHCWNTNGKLLCACV